MKLDFPSLSSRLKDLKDLDINFVKSGWDRLHGLPGGKHIFSRAVGRVAPYSGSIPFVVEELSAGYSRISLVESGPIRNHLGSIHAIALANLAELSGNLALAYGMPSDARFIVTELKMEYLKKARGRIEARCQTAIPSSSDRRSYEIEVEIFDANQSLVSRCLLTSLVGPRKAKVHGS